MALPLETASPLPTLSPLFQNAAPSGGNAAFMSFLRARQANKPPRAPNPAEQMGGSANASLLGGNFVSPAMRALMAGFS